MLYNVHNIIGTDYIILHILIFKKCLLLVNSVGILYVVLFLF